MAGGHPLRELKQRNRTTPLEISAFQKATGLSNSNYKLPDAGSKPTPAQEVASVTVNVRTVNAKALNAAVAKAGGSAGSIRTIILGKKTNKKYAKKYKKIFTKKNCGKMVTIK